MSSSDLIVQKHVEYAGKMLACLKIRDYLVKQIHHKKCVKNDDGTYRVPIDEEHMGISDVYHRILFTGQFGLNMFDAWPCEFKGFMENAFFDELKSAGILNAGEEVTHVYYKFEDPDTKFYSARQAFMNEVVGEWHEWDLEAVHEITELDERVIKKYMSTLVDFMKVALEVTSNRPDHEKKILSDEYLRVSALFQF